MSKIHIFKQNSENEPYHTQPAKTNGQSIFQTFAHSVSSPDIYKTLILYNYLYNKRVEKNLYSSLLNRSKWSQVASISRCI